MQGAVLVGPEQIDIREVPVPRPGPGEVLLKVRAATTCGTDVKVFRRGGHPRMLQVPTLFGHEMAGEIAAVGEGTAGFEPGQAVVVANSAPCGRCGYCEAGRENLCEDLQYINGAFAPYLLVPARFVQRNTHALPPELGFERAALTEPLACVIHGAWACELETRASSGLSALSGVSGVSCVVLGGGPIGLLFVACLARDGHHVVLADPNPGRLEVGKAMGAQAVVQLDRAGGNAGPLRAASPDGKGPEVAIDCTGSPLIWRDAVQAVRPGGLVNFFGGCAPGTTVELDTHLVHYSELTLKGVYHHRPATIRAALELLSDPVFPADHLLSARMAVKETEAALRAMMNKTALKVVIDPAL